MDEDYFNDVFEWKVNRRKPPRFRGKRQKGSWKMWKLKVEKMSLLRRNTTESLTKENTIVMMERQGKYRIFPRESELDKLWEHFHCNSITAGHQGINTMRRRVCEIYFIPKFQQWAIEKLRNCTVCSLVRRKNVIPATGAIVPKVPKKCWQIDFIGKFKPDSKTGHRFATFT